MTGFGAWLAARLGVDPAAFDRWQFLWGRYPSGILLALALGALAGYLYLSWRANSVVEARTRRSLLTGMRLAAAGLAAILLFDPSVEFLKIKEKDESFAVLFDTSRSMNFGIPNQGTRLDFVRDIVTGRGEQFQRLERRYNTRYLTFDDGVRPTTRADFATIVADGRATRIGEAIDTVVQSMAADPPVGILLFTDGADQGRLRSAVRGQGRLAGVPIYPFLLPDDPLADVAVTRLDAAPYAFVRNAMEIDATIAVHNLPITSINVTLRQDDQVVATQKATLRPGETEVKVNFRFTPQRVGRFVYTVEVPIFPEEAIVENNRRHAVVNVVRDRVRVLQVVGEPSWDARFLRRYLERDPNVDLISFMILRTAENRDPTPDSELSLIPFPTQELFTEELQSFDLVIFQNFDFRPYFHIFPGQLLENLRRFVVQDGGGFLMIGGDKSFLAGGYAGTPIEAILPLRLPPGSPIDFGEFRPTLTESGLRHPVTNLDLPAHETASIWGQMPELPGTNIVGPAKPEAVVLMRHPVLQTAGEAMPVMGVMEAGAGRTMAMTVDASWMWSFLAGAQGMSGTHYQRFWNNTIRWLVHDPEFGQVRLESDADAYLLGDTAQIRCLVLDDRYQASPDAKARIAARRRAPEAEWHELDTERVDDGVFAAGMPAQQAGIYDLRCEASNQGETLGEETHVITVDALDQESQDTSVYNALLTTLAERSGGRTLSAADRDWLARIGTADEETGFEVIGKHVARIWDNAFLLLVLAALLSGEWLLRRRWGGV